ncbi:protein Vhl [Phlebotomus argentipes]|uniref:protein Vhl n=1 Tax=Phlebotomus argentipes TaxID=94469 RepID=UPI002893063B|nr:protein Vhl [Phlebotomus argentipes]
MAEIPEAAVQPVQPVPPEELEPRSVDSTHRAFVLFHNTTKRQVEIFWINYSGKLVSFGILQPDQRRRVDTFCTHPWTYKDAVTKENLFVSGQKVFYPTIWYKGAVDLSRMLVRRQVARIHHGMRTLREIALEAVALQLPNAYSAEELELPKSIAEELIRVYKELHNELPSQ